MQTPTPVDKFARVTLAWVERLGLFIIMLATVVAGGNEVARMVGERTVQLADLLLLFIYLEVLTMVGVYYSSGSLPVRMPLYIAIVALARHMILDMKEMTDAQLLVTAVGILIIAAAVLVLRFGHVKLPYGKGDDH